MSWGRRPTAPPTATAAVPGRVAVPVELVEAVLATCRFEGSRASHDERDEVARALAVAAGLRSPEVA